MWAAMFFNITAFFLFLRPQTRENFFTLNIACVLIIIGVYIEKGMGLSVPGFVPGTLGEIYEYGPTFVEKTITVGVWATGALIYTLLMKFAIPIYTGELRFYTKDTNP
jgi:molybdopterin-containing oxidoreductase family membrane subunit